MRLAIVGSTQFPKYETEQLAISLIGHFIATLQPDVVVSGGAAGVDEWAEGEAKFYGIPTKIYLPKNSRWAPDGYADRNLLIANDCDHLIAIRSRTSKTYGSGWTADRAEGRLGRSCVERILL